MDNYTNIVERQMRVNKKRNAFTLIGIIIGVVLFTAIVECNVFVNKYRIEASILMEGDIEGTFYNLPSDKVKILENNVEIKDYSLVAKDSQEQMPMKNGTQNVHVYSVNDNLISTTYKDSLNLVEGKFPADSNQIILERKAKVQYEKSLGDVFKVGDKEYIISGFFKIPYTRQMELVGLSGMNNPSDYQTVTAFLRLKSKTNKIEILEKIAKDLNIQIANNEDIDGFDQNKISYLVSNIFLLNNYDEYIDGNSFTQRNIIQIILGSLVFISTVILIYSSINSSTKEKSKQIGLLRCIGATPSQIRGIIFKESLILGGLAIVPGILIGHIGIYIIVNMVVKRHMGLDFIEIDSRITLSIVVWVILATFVTIIISTIRPAFKASTSSPLDSIKGVYASKNNTAKSRKNKFIRKILGVEGELAYKNLRSSNKEFILTMLTLSISLVLFIVLTGYVYSFLKGTSIIDNKKFTDAKIYAYSYLNEENQDMDYRLKENLSNIDENRKILKDIKAELKNNKVVKDIYLEDVYQKDIMIENIGDFNTQFETTYIQRNNEIDNTLFHNGQIIVYDGDSFNKIKDSIQGENINLESFDNNGVIFVNPMRIQLNGKIIQNKATNLKSSTNIKLYPVELDDSYKIFDNNYDDSLLDKIKSKHMSLNVMGTISRNNMISTNRMISNNSFTIIISESTYEEYKNMIINDGEMSIPSHTLGFDFYNEEKRKEYSEKIRDYANIDLGYYYEDYEEEINYNRSFIIGMSIIAYSFLGLIMMIIVLNIINSRSFNILSRKKEFGTLIAIGMNKKDLIKSIIFEGIINWCISCMVAIPISYVALKYIFMYLINQGLITSPKIPLGVILLGMSGLLIINILSMIEPIRKYQKFDMIEMIKNDE
ncbi:ABC transporter permease [Romboutsia weinsteinii]|uniref:ABC transporter permease n=1 Tax=Romboutsia weinsteinii TaxID=2020949 RepID=A0A371J053_9FIRM|nr:ABC transporter permease [Romboutsia weinsteinii]RDY26140.1 ABC transporter permease [Romboutsia weinsteinii]